MLQYVTIQGGLTIASEIGPLEIVDFVDLPF